MEEKTGEGETIFSDETLPETVAKVGGSVSFLLLSLRGLVLHSCRGTVLVLCLPGFFSESLRVYDKGKGPHNVRGRGWAGNQLQVRVSFQSPS